MACKGPGESYPATVARQHGGVGFAGTPVTYHAGTRIPCRNPYEALSTP